MGKEATSMKTNLPTAKEMFEQSMKTRKILEKAHLERRKLLERHQNPKGVNSAAKAK